MVKGKFSVVIPTLQRSPELWPLVDQLAAHLLVHEVLVVNNAPEPLAWNSSKVQVLQQVENIYVNPAWNLGAREAVGEYLAIVNDDVRFDDQVLDFCAGLLRRGVVGLVGPDGSCFSSTETKGITWRLATREHVAIGFGMFMALRRADYVPIPERVRIWGGDDWLFLQSRRPPAVMLGARFETEPSTTSGSPEFMRLRQEELEAANAMLGAVVGSRWWHRPAATLASTRRLRWRLLRGR